MAFVSSERIVVLRPSDALSFIADACAAVADAINEPHAWTESDPELVEVYAELVVAYARLVRPRMEGVRAAVIDHLIDRAGQARRGEIVTPLVDIADRLHGEL